MKEENKARLGIIIVLILIIGLSFAINKCNRVSAEPIDLSPHMEFYIIPEVGSYNPIIDGDDTTESITEPNGDEE